MKRVRINSGVLGVALVLGTVELFSFAWAEEGSPGACREDAQKFCGDVTPGQGAVMNCLQQHQGDLSGDCQSRLTQIKQRVRQREGGGGFLKACQADREKFCKDVPSGQGRIIRCLNQHQDELSADCQQKLQKLATVRRKWKPSTPSNEPTTPQESSPNQPPPAAPPPGETSSPESH